MTPLPSGRSNKKLEDQRPERTDNQTVGDAVTEDLYAEAARQREGGK
jgi:hypothetical protein